MAKPIKTPLQQTGVGVCGDVSATVGGQRGEGGDHHLPQFLHRTRRGDRQGWLLLVCYVILKAPCTMLSVGRPLAIWCELHLCKIWEVACIMWLWVDLCIWREMTNVTSPKRRFSCATDFTDEDCNRTVTISLETWTVAGEFLHSR